MKDFIHGSLVKAASTDGIETMLKGAGIGAGANVGIGAVQGDFDVIGNAFSGAALGAGAGAALRYGAMRYGSNLMAGKSANVTKLDTNIFTKPDEANAMKFFGDDDNTRKFASEASNYMPTGKAASTEGTKTGATATDGSQTGKVDTKSKDPTVQINSQDELREAIYNRQISEMDSPEQRVALKHSEAQKRTDAKIAAQKARSDAKKIHAEGISGKHQMSAPVFNQDAFSAMQRQTQLPFLTSQKQAPQQLPFKQKSIVNQIKDRGAERRAGEINYSQTPIVNDTRGQNLQVLPNSYINYSTPTNNASPISTPMSEGLKSIDAKIKQHETNQLTQAIRGSQGHI